MKKEVVKKVIYVLLLLGLSALSTVLLYAYVTMLYMSKERFYWMLAPAIIAMVITLGFIVLYTRKEKEFPEYAKTFVLLVMGVIIAAVAFFLFQHYFQQIKLGGRKNKLFFFAFGGGSVVFLETLTLFITFLINNRKPKGDLTNE